MISKKDALEFPFLKESQKLAKTLEIEMDLNKVYSDPEMVSLVDEYLSEVYHNRFYMHKPAGDLETSIKRFVGTCIVANQIGKPVNIRRFALFESKYHCLKVEHKDKEMFPIYFNMVFEEVWGRPNFIEKTKDGNYYAVKVPDFLKFKRKIDTNQEYALVNQAVVGGYVVFGKEVLLHILQVGLEFFLQERVKSLFKEVPVRKHEHESLKGSKFSRGLVIPAKLAEIIKKFEFIDLHMSVYKSPPNKDLQDFNIEKLKEHIVKKKGQIPPCISYLMRKCQRGEHLPHFERFTLMTFLLAREDPEDEILSLFEKTSNYKKDEIDYLLKHTKKVGYKTPNCSKMDDNKICFRNSVCGGCRNPLQLISS